jgi:hypothetical protein
MTKSGTRMSGSKIIGSIHVHSWLNKSHARKNAWLTSLRRHYPHQVQGVSSPAIAGPNSQPLRLPRIFFLGQDKTRANEVNNRDIARRCRYTADESYPPAGASFTLV